MKNFRRVMAGIDVTSLLDQVAAHPTLWNADDAWTRAKGTDCVLYAVNDIVLRYMDPTPPHLPKHYNRKAFALLHAAQKIVLDLMRAIPGDALGKVIISRMAPGEVIKPHIDMMPLINPHMPSLGRIPASYQRYQIPLYVKPGVVFLCGDEKLYMEPGTAWWFDNQITHSVTNGSNEDRISMLCDIRPFDIGTV